MAASPQPETRPLVPTEEEFAAWCEQPVTRFVAQAFALGAQLQKTAWLGQSWEQGKADPLALMEYRTRADAYEAFLASTWADYLKTVNPDAWSEWNNERIETERAARLRSGAPRAATLGRPAEPGNHRRRRAGSGPGA